MVARVGLYVSVSAGIDLGANGEIERRWLGNRLACLVRSKVSRPIDLRSPARRSQPERRPPQAPTTALEGGLCRTPPAFRTELARQAPWLASSTVPPARSEKRRATSPTSSPTLVMSAAASSCGRPTTRGTVTMSGIATVRTIGVPTATRVPAHCPGRPPFRAARP